MADNLKIYRDKLSLLRDEHRFRSIPQDCEGQDNIDLCSNDYLALANRHKEFIPEFLDRFGDASFSSSASRLLCGRQKYFRMLEEYLQKIYGRPALIFNSGYHTNVGLISALNTDKTIFLCDRLIHASAIDGIRMSGARFARWNHNDIDSLENLLKKYSSDYDRLIVVAESIYSMDGDIAPIKSILSLKDRFPGIMLYLDEAHAVGVRGIHGCGVAEELGCINEVDILVGTFGKACASVGAFVSTSPLLYNYFLNTARSFIFSTALPPVNIAWTLLMLEKIYNMEEERHRLKEISFHFKNKIKEITGETTSSESQIIPLVTGDAEKALKISAFLRENNIDALAIRRPTVPPGEERIRFSLNADITYKDIEKVGEVLRLVY